MKLDDWINKKIFDNEKVKLTREDIDYYQLERLNYLIEYTKQNSSFYRKLYKDIDKLNSLDELKKLPITNKYDILECDKKMVCVSQSEISRIVSLKTSGTTGKSKTIYFTEEDQELTIDFFGAGISLLTEKGDTMMILLPCERENGVGDLIRKGLKNIEVTPVAYGLLDTFEKCANSIIENNVNSIVGMPIEVLALGRYIKEKNLNVNIKSILLSADMVSREIVEEIKDAYDCEVFNHFGITEAGLGCAVECSYHTGMHIRENDILVEIVDPITKEPLEDGELGRVLITTLTRAAMPLIRYETGDIGSIVPGTCPCQSPLKRLDYIDYREANVFYLDEDKFINIKDIDGNLFKMKNLINYKVEIEDKSKLKMELAVLDLNDSIKEDISKKEKLILKAKELLLNIDAIESAVNKAILQIEISVECTDKWTPYYMGKRKIIYK